MGWDWNMFFFFCFNPNVYDYKTFKELIATMNFFIDLEFCIASDTIISLGIVSEDDKHRFYEVDRKSVV